MSTGYTIALAGFSAFERNVLVSSFRLLAGRHAHFEEVGPLAQAD